MNVWQLTYEGYDPAEEALRETLCTLGNGYFATRGAAPEAAAGGAHYPGTYVAGCFNRLKTDVSGQVLENECVVNQPNWLPLTFRVDDGDWFDLSQVEVLSYRQELDIRRGILSRNIRFQDSRSRRSRVVQRRFVHLTDPHLAGLETTITAENWSGRLRVLSALDGRVENTGVERYRQLNNQHLIPVESEHISDNIVYLKVETSQSRIKTAQAARTRLFKDGRPQPVKPLAVEGTGYIGQEFGVDFGVGESIIVEKIVSLFTSRDKAISECGLEARRKAEQAPGFGTLLDSHALGWDDLWRRHQFIVEGDERAAQILNLHIFHLLQTVSPNSIDLDVGVPARGLHGEAYRGHIFWDELFIFPLLNLHLPNLARALLLYRYRRLPEARLAAADAGFVGAMFPWQSGSNGREESQSLHLNPKSGRWVPDKSHRQRHINIAIAYNVWHYYQATGDTDFMSSYGAELMLEIARFWASVAQHNASLDRYEIRGVMGPDEYHDGYPEVEEPGLNNNAYTNVMAVWVLQRAREALELLPAEERSLIQLRLGLHDGELERWLDIGRNMFVPFHGDGIISQFQGYEQLEELDWDGYRERYGDIQRLDRILEAEGDTANRYKVSKQADVLMLCYLLSSDEIKEIFEKLGYSFHYETIPKNIDYYMARTSHGSTLSRVVHSWVLARSQRQRSWEFFKDALESDVSDIQGGTTGEGIHLGAMAGTIDLIQRCYSGMETRDGILWLNPRLPSDLSEVRFGIRYRGQWVDLQFTHDSVNVTSSEGRGSTIKLGIDGEIVALEPGECGEIHLRPKVPS